MELTDKQVFKDEVKVLSITEFIDTYAPGLKIQAIDYAMRNDKVDYIYIGKDRFVVLTEKTRTYVPNKNKAREVVVKKTKMKL